MRVLVTGAAGFVGYAVAALLVEHGHQVMGLTRSQASALPTGVQRLHGDLRRPQTLPQALADIDAVCHLAGLTKVRESRTDPLDYWRTNVGGTLAILDKLASAPGGRVVHASTCAVYGEQAEQPISETAAVAPTSPYGTSKLAADQAAADLAATGAFKGIPVVAGFHRTKQKRRDGRNGQTQQASPTPSDATKRNGGNSRHPYRPETSAHTGCRRRWAAGHGPPLPRPVRHRNPARSTRRSGTGYCWPCQSIPTPRGGK